jgi:hypothetical protein
MTALPTKAEVRLLAMSPRSQESDSRRSCAIASPMVESGRNAGSRMPLGDCQRMPVSDDLFRLAARTIQQ